MAAITDANDAAAIGGEARCSKTEHCHAIHLNDPTTVTNPDSGEAQLTEVDAPAPSRAFRRPREFHLQRRRLSLEPIPWKRS
ncbi:MAG: hypothetical protein GY859_40715 [Desulfobacterales bacterium]|nr:hypothetical protein [Desulfobacterales bacterium]